MMRIACYRPEIAGNMGAVLRLAACFEVAVDVIEPCGFVWSDAKMRRAGMDYARRVDVKHHCDWTAFRAGVGRAVLLTTRGDLRLPDFAFCHGDTLVMGSESSGVPIDVAQSCDARIRIPIGGEVRSLNLAVATAIALYEAQRQLGVLPE
jgi:tRNA (cytidine/uridine-2'-O-)-methyltransferase